jgi:hypothetical protein
MVTLTSCKTTRRHNPEDRVPQWENYLNKYEYALQRVGVCMSDDKGSVSSCHIQLPEDVCSQIIDSNKKEPLRTAGS